MQLDQAMFDVALPLHGHLLPRDHAGALADALRAHLPWLAGEPDAGVHPVKVVECGEAQALLSRRARLLLRVPGARLAELAALEGAELDVAGCCLRLGAPKAFDLVPHVTLYSPRVATGAQDEAGFMEDVDFELGALGVECQCICGRSRALLHHGERIAAFSLMLHGLKPAQSLQILCRGLGGHRQLGCGVFVPHKSASAVAA